MELEQHADSGSDDSTCSASWVLIETAPKDGTQILITDGEQIEVGHWGTVLCTISTRCGWIYGPGDIYSSYDEMETPTHWTPLPSLPNAIGEAPNA
jgi:hypothetical protein